jgi:hypothetical protein
LLDCTLKFLLASIFFVFNLSTKISHAKNLTMGVTLDFQTRWKVAGICIVKNANL